MKELKKDTKNYSLIAGIFIIALAAFLGFQPLFEILSNNAAQQFTAAIFGSIFSIVLMIFLLNKQTEIEEEKERGQRVFEEKVRLFNSIFDSMENVFEDGLITPEEMVKFEFMIIRLQVLASDETIQKFTEFHKKLNQSFDEEANALTIKSEDRTLLLRFASQCRLELGLSKTDMNENLFNDVTKTIQEMEKTRKSSFSEEDMLDNSSDNAKELFQKFKEAILNISDNITIRSTKMYIGFVANKRNVADIHVFKKHLKMWINLKSGKLEDPKNLTKDVSQTGHWGNGDYEIQIENDEDLEYIMTLVKQSYVQKSNNS